jgi:glycosyltransferase involved in cell wall biosynthesis
MHVLIATPYYPNAADPLSGNFIARQAATLTARGHQVDVVHIVPRPAALRRGARRWAERMALPAHEERDGIAVHRVHFPSVTQRRPLRGLQAAGIAGAVGGLLQRVPRLRAADVLYAQWLVPFGYGCWLAARSVGLPCLAIGRGADVNAWAEHPALRRQLLTLLVKVDGLLGNGAYVRAQLERLRGGPLPQPMHVVYNPCDLRAFLTLDPYDAGARRSARAALGLDPDGPTVLFLGALDVRKGPDTLVDALAALHARDPRWRLVLAGDGPLAAPLRARVARLGLERAVCFLGAVPHERTPLLLAAADVTALPSRRDGLANVLVEALAAGVPTVATPVGGTTELVVDGRTGWLVPPDDPHALAHALAGAVRARSVVAPAGRRRVRELFDVERNVERLEGLMASLGRARVREAYA